MLGFDPYPTQKWLSTAELVDVSLKAMHAPPEVRSQYQKNVAILVRFITVFHVYFITVVLHVQRKVVREENPPSNKFHRNFRLWLDRNPALDEAAVLEDDKTIDYSQKGTIEGEIDASRSAERPGGPNGGHYIDPENPSFPDDLYESEGYSP